METGNGQKFFEKLILKLGLFKISFCPNVLEYHCFEALSYLYDFFFIFGNYKEIDPSLISQQLFSRLLRFVFVRKIFI